MGKKRPTLDTLSRLQGGEGNGVAVRDETGGLRDVGDEIGVVQRETAGAWTKCFRLEMLSGLFCSSVIS